jgi:hypothetical protein
MIAFFLFLHFITRATANQITKIDFPGCPENALCPKETGAHRLEWLDILTKFEQKKLSEKEVNKQIQLKLGLPIPLWATEEATKKPLAMLWNSPCKQHNIPTNKTYIAVTFLKNLLPKNNILFHSPAILLDIQNRPHSIMVLRGDAPLFIVNDSLYYTQDDEGHFYGLLVSPQGQLSISKVLFDSHYPREITCSKEQIEMFNRETPSPNFFQGYYCKEIWNTKSKTYQSLLVGWSCN